MSTNHPFIGDIILRIGIRGHRFITTIIGDTTIIITPIGTITELVLLEIQLTITITPTEEQDLPLW